MLTKGELMEWAAGVMLLVIGFIILASLYKKVGRTEEVEVPIKAKESVAEQRINSLTMEVGKLIAALEEDRTAKDRSIEFLASQVNKLENQVAADKLAGTSAKPPHTPTPVIKFPDVVKIELVKWPPLDVEMIHALRMILTKGKVKPSPMDDFKKQAEKTAKQLKEMEQDGR